MSRIPTATSSASAAGQPPANAVRDALDLRPGDKLTWEIRGGRVAITAELPELYRWKGFIKRGPADAVKAVAAARKTRGHI
jgi:hypothetical protein